MKKFVKSVMVMAMAVAFAGAAHAGSTAANMWVSADAQAAVQLYVLSNLGFGSFDNSVAGTVETTAQIEVTAPVGLNYDVTIDAGYYFSGASRQVGNGLAGLAYNLYQDAGHTIEWGDSGFGNTYPAGSSLFGTGTGIAQPYTVYGVLTKDILVSGGYYDDLLTVTAIW